MDAPILILRLIAFLAAALQNQDVRESMLCISSKESAAAVLGNGS